MKPPDARLLNQWPPWPLSGRRRAFPEPRAGGQGSRGEREGPHQMFEMTLNAPSRDPVRPAAGRSQRKRSGYGENAGEMSGRAGQGGKPDRGARLWAILHSWRREWPNARDQLQDGGGGTALPARPGTRARRALYGGRRNHYTRRPARPPEPWAAQHGHAGGRALAAPADPHARVAAAHPAEQHPASRTRQCRPSL